MTIPSNEEMIQIAMTPPSRDGAQGSPNDSSCPSARASPQGRRAFPSDQEASTSIRKSPGGGGRTKDRRTGRPPAPHRNPAPAPPPPLPLAPAFPAAPGIARWPAQGPREGQS